MLLSKRMFVVFLGAVFFIPCLFATAQMIDGDPTKTVGHQGYVFEIEREYEIIEWIFPYIIYTLMMFLLHFSINPGERLLKIFKL